MAAMDVVDTIRHQQSIAEREFDGENRRERLLARLKELYAAQGIEVSDAVLLEGIDALEEERFKYQPVEKSWQTKLANIWVSRGKWGKPLGFLTVLGGLFSGVYFVTDVMPENKLRSELPKQLQSQLSKITNVAKNPAIVAQAQDSLKQGQAALEKGDLEKAAAIEDEMEQALELLQTEYKIRIVLKPGKMSALWRVPDINPNGKNYYLVVEAIDNKNKVVPLPILSEETNKRETVKTWAIRVNEATFLRVAADKKDDGIIQNNLVGQKQVGYLRPKFSIPTTGGAITKW